MADKKSEPRGSPQKTAMGMKALTEQVSSLSTQPEDEDIHLSEGADSKAEDSKMARGIVDEQGAGVLPLSDVGFCQEKGESQHSDFGGDDIREGINDYDENTGSAIQETEELSERNDIPLKLKDNYLDITELSQEQQELLREFVTKIITKEADIIKDAEDRVNIIYGEKRCDSVNEGQPSKCDKQDSSTSKNESSLAMTLDKKRNFWKEKILVFLDWDNCPSFFVNLEDIPTEKIVVYAFHGQKFQPGTRNCNYTMEEMEKNGQVRIYRCGQTKNSADFSLSFLVGEMNMVLPKSVAFRIVSGDKGLYEIDRLFNIRKTRSFRYVNLKQDRDTLDRALLED